MEQASTLRKAPEQHVVSTASVPVRQRVDFWRDAIRSDLLDLSFQVPDGVDFDASLVTTRLAPLSVLSINSSASTVHRGGGGPKRADDLIMFNFVFSGQLVAQQDGRTTIVSAGDGVMCTGERPYTLHLPQATRLACIHLSTEKLAHVVPGLHRAIAMSFRQASELAPMVSSHASLLVDSMHTLSSEGAHTLARNFTDILFAMISQVATKGDLGLSEQRSLLLMMTRDFIERNLSNPELDAARVCSAMKLSHRYINRMFQEENSSLARYIWRRRLEKAAHDLQAPALRCRGISQIALSNGFNDMSHFSKAFRSLYGVSPRDFRSGVPSSS